MPGKPHFVHKPFWNIRRYLSCKSWRGLSSKAIHISGCSAGLEYFSFSCCLIFDIFADVAWFRGQTLLEPNEKFEMFKKPQENSYHLVMYDTKVEDGGIYRCVAIGNKGEEKWHEFSLQFIGKLILQIIYFIFGSFANFKIWNDFYAKDLLSAVC